MQVATHLRPVILSALLIAGAVLYLLTGEPVGAGTPHWPSEDEVFAADGWTVGPQQVERINTADFVTREYHNTRSGVVATLTIETHQSPKLYAAGPEVPFLGSGYAVSTPPADLVPHSTDTIGSLVAQRANETWLVMYAYGERRGLLGNGPTAWALAIGDAISGHQNDYYKLYLNVQTSELNPDLGNDVSELAHTIFPRVQAWYGRVA